ncbi:expressed unknown protein [Seminavis robusta]|uniref:GH26 domain-containing protein n=1 Tax=Seminavis robusta TaxID=568900 RepID=A0A9N8DLG6_9STRA|nr:expressed unknown protein [Seminavis robusta]|eukprot:Sro207_g086920.1 n/a (592) ;mRNA; f:65522-67507
MGYMSKKKKGDKGSSTISIPPRRELTQSQSQHQSGPPPPPKPEDDLCLPPESKTYLTIGQDLFSIQEYIQEQQNASLHWYMKRQQRHGSVPMPVPRTDNVIPAALMVYTDIQTLRGLDHPVDYGTGIEYADGALRMASPPTNPLGVGLQIGLWLNGTQGCRDIVSGKLDDNVKRLVYYIGVQSPASKVFLRIGYEFDNPDFNYAHDPNLYRQAFSYIARKCRKHKACQRRTEMVWHSWGAGLPYNTTLQDFYPGNDWVDWIGVSVFQQFYPILHRTYGGTPQDLHNVLEFAAAHGRPTMIAESTPFGGIHNNPHIPTTTDIWTAWFAPTLDLIRKYEIGMWSYINCNWEAQPAWKGVGFGDTRLSIDPMIMEQWHEHVIASRRFVRAIDYELCGNYPGDYYNDHEFDYVSQYDYDHHYRSKSAGSHDDDDDFFRKRNNNQKDYPRRYDYFKWRFDDDDDKVSNDDGNKWIWGKERNDGRGDALWNAVLPIVMLSSSLAIMFFIFNTTNRKSFRARMHRTPRAQRVRFARLDDEDDPDDESVALYGSIVATDDDNTSVMSERDSLLLKKRPVRRVTPQLIVANTADGFTLVA